ncbi:hypothetical protein GE061_015361 [Apolygus lucorum]|uniref:Fidgetin-like protein 1 n=1 Tax=Apolygus lucorum TaxID=248454 RepID=A0A8S9XKX0_APOLU|nr:hypothetical protein GE061_015361 [Apolygus lucorum]
MPLGQVTCWTGLTLEPTTYDFWSLVVARLRTNFPNCRNVISALTVEPTWSCDYVRYQQHSHPSPAAWKRFCGRSIELIASGIPSLDTVLGGGLPLGSIVLLTEDELGTYSDMFLKTYLAQGLVHGDTVFLATPETNVKAFCECLPAPMESHADELADPKIVSRCYQLSDIVFGLVAIDSTSNPLYSEYTGLFQLHKISPVNSLTPLAEVSDDWAFKLIKKRLLIERLTLPPELDTVLRKLSSDASSLPPNLALNTERANILLKYRYTAKRKGDWLASEILGNQLREYGNRVDDRQSINNFASATLELACKLRKDCKGWKSGLPLSGPPNLQEFLKNVDSGCANTSEQGCTAAVPSSHELHNFKLFMSRSNPETQKAQNHELPLVESSRIQAGPLFRITPLAPHTANRIPYRQPSSHHPPPTDLKQTGFIAKKPSSSFGHDRDFSSNQSTVTNNVVPHRKPFSSHESNSIKTSNFGSSVGGIYSSRVGGRFKKWGNNEKEEEPVQSSEDDFSRRESSRGRGGFRGYGGRNQFDGSSFEEKHEQPPIGMAAFKTAREQLKIENQKKYGNSHGPSFGGNNHSETSYGGYGNGKYDPARTIKKSLGGKGVVNSKFVSPLISNNTSSDGRQQERQTSNSQENEEIDERLKNIEPRMIELIKNEIMDCGSKITWDDIAGLHFAKTTIQEIVVWPMLRPDIFTGLRRPPKGILLFGPPGTGKTLIGKCIASQSGSTFFSISASSLTSKWIGEGEKMVRALFAVARVHQPAVVFIDEIDSLLSQRSESEHESSRRIKTEFLVQLDGAGTDEEDRLLVIGATNRPQELDEAARRRLVKRLYIPLPDLEARKEMVQQLMKCERNELNPQEIDELAKSSDGFSGADMKHLCQEACLGPIRSLGPSQISSIAAHQVRPVNMSDFTSALKRVHPSVGPDDLHQYVTWNKTYGSGPNTFRFRYSKDLKNYSSV